MKLGEEEEPVGDKWFAIELAPGAGATLQVEIERWVNPGSYRFPWEVAQ
ncbi:MAG: hypothetical protein R2724_31945 [Bryobacterales bacterium]